MGGWYSHFVDYNGDDKHSEFVEYFRPDTVGPEYILVARWLRHLGGHWVGYLGRVDGTPLGDQDHFYCGISGAILTSKIAVLQIPSADFILTGFDCAHPGDSNVGPEGEQGRVTLDVERIWTKEKVFEHLREVATLYS